MTIAGALAFALIAAFGNALFATGQKKAVDASNPILFVALAAVVCIGLTALVVPLFGKTDIAETIRSNGRWAVVSGVGLFLTYLGFNLLYTRYGASHYVLYAVISIVTTSVIVGVVIFKEGFNVFHLLAVVSAFATVIFYSLGQARL